MMGKPLELIKDAAQDKPGCIFPILRNSQKTMDTTYISDTYQYCSCCNEICQGFTGRRVDTKPLACKIFTVLRPVKKTVLETGPHILTRFEALPRVGLVDSSSLLTAGLLELTQIPVGGIIRSTDRLDVRRTALDTLTVRFIFPDNTMAMEWTKVDITWS